MRLGHALHGRSVSHLQSDVNQIVYNLLILL